MEMFFLSYANELSICLRICLSWLNKPVCFTHGNVLLSYVNETMYLLGNLPFFKIHVNCFMAGDDSPFAILSQNACCGRGVLSLSVSLSVTITLSLEAFLLLG